MADEPVTEAAPAPRCTWCSAQLDSETSTTCPSCGATLVGEGDSQVPGVTAIDAEAIVRAARGQKAKPRSRLMSWISGDYENGEPSKPAPPGSLAPPSPDVRREMLRLELEAEVANLQAEAEALAADAAVEAEEAGIPVALGGDDGMTDAPVPAGRTGTGDEAADASEDRRSA